MRRVFRYGRAGEPRRVGDGADRAPRRHHRGGGAPLLRPHQPAHGLPARPHARRCGGRPRGCRSGVRSRLGGARGDRPPAPPVGALRRPSRRGPARDRSPRALPGLRADRTRRRRVAAPPAARRRLPPEARRAALGRGPARRQRPPHHRRRRRAGPRERAGGSRVVGPRPDPHAPGAHALAPERAARPPRGPAAAWRNKRDWPERPRRQAGRYHRCTGMASPWSGRREPLRLRPGSALRGGRRGAGRARSARAPPRHRDRRPARHARGRGQRRRPRAQRGARACPRPRPAPAAPCSPCARPRRSWSTPRRRRCSRRVSASPRGSRRPARASSTWRSTASNDCSAPTPPSPTAWRAWPRAWDCRRGSAWPTAAWRRAWPRGERAPAWRWSLLEAIDSRSPPHPSTRWNSPTISWPPSRAGASPRSASWPRCRARAWPTASARRACAPTTSPTAAISTPFRPYTPPPFWEEALGLDWEIDALPALAVALEMVLDRLTARLAAARLAADALSLRLGLASGGEDDRLVPLAYPLREPGPMLALLRLSLEAHPPPAPVTRIALSASAIALRPAPRELWEPAGPAPRDLETVLSRLVTLATPQNVGSPVITDSHRPDAFVLAPFVPPAGGRVEAEGRADSLATPLALRRLRPPRRVEVDDRRHRPRRRPPPRATDRSTAAPPCASSPAPAPGASPANGGTPSRGRATSGTSSWPTAWSAASPATASKATGTSTASMTDEQRDDSMDSAEAERTGRAV